MFKKCLKYDLAATRKIWLIAAAVMLLLAIVGGIGISGIPIASLLMESQAASGPNMGLFAAVALMFVGVISYIAIIYAVAIFTGGVNILLYVRYYRHFFSDQGYLTFTLPVKRSTLFWSKTVSGLIYMLATLAVSFVSILCAELGFVTPALLSPQIAEIMGMSFQGLFAGLSLLDALYGLVLLVLFLVLAVVIEFASLMLQYLIITLAATLFRSRKALGVIGVYAGIGAASMMLYFVTYFIWAIYLVLTIAMLGMGLFALFAVPVLGWLGIYLLILVLIAAALTAGTVFANCTMQRLERKLNLS